MSNGEMFPIRDPVRQTFIQWSLEHDETSLRNHSADRIILLPAEKPSLSMNETEQLTLWE